MVMVFAVNGFRGRKRWQREWNEGIQTVIGSEGENLKFRKIAPAHFGLLLLIVMTGCDRVIQEDGERILRVDVVHHTDLTVTVVHLQRSEG